MPREVGDFRLLSRQAARAMRQFREQHRFMRGMVAWLGLKEAFVPFERQARAASETKYPLWKMVRFSWTLDVQQKPALVFQDPTTSSAPLGTFSVEGKISPSSRSRFWSGTPARKSASSNSGAVRLCRTARCSGCCAKFRATETWPTDRARLGYFRRPGCAYVGLCLIRVLDANLDMQVDGITAKHLYRYTPYLTFEMRLLSVQILSHPSLHP